MKVTFNATGAIASLEPADIINCGTVVQVRDIFKNNKFYRKKFM
jgi:DNA mismatch repair ATPase MutL